MPACQPCRVAILAGLMPVITGLPVLLSAQSADLTAARAAEQRRISVIQQAVPATVCIFSANGQSGGSGVLVSPEGFALTNFHVVEPCGKHMHCGLPDGSIYDAVLVGIDPVGDVALIRLLGRDDFPVARMGDSDQVRIGDFCFAVGNPFLLAGNFQPSVSWGIVSGVHRYQYPSGTLLEYADSIQTDAAINPGNSGGALFDGQGELIGINGRGSFEKRGRVNVGVGFAISINQIRMFYDHLLSGRIVDHATLGATVTSDRRGLIRVSDIRQGSDAWRRGLRYGDEVVSLGGHAVTSVNDFKNILGTFPAGWRVPLEFRRDEKVVRIRVRLEGVHTPQQLAERVQQRPPRERPVPDQGPPDESGPAIPRASVPEPVTRWIEDRPGFANYYFNRLQTDRIWTAYHQVAGTLQQQERVRMSGSLDDGTPVQLVLSVARSGIQLGDQARVIEQPVDLSLPDELAGSGGLLTALHLWYRLLHRGPDRTGDTGYAGKLPGPDEELADVLACNTDGVQVRFLFGPDSGLLDGIEFFSAADRDPCEIGLADYRRAGQVSLPHLITVTCGDQYRREIRIDKINLDP